MKDGIGSWTAAGESSSTPRLRRSPTRRAAPSSPASSLGELSVTELAEPSSMSQPAISLHLKVL